MLKVVEFYSLTGGFESTLYPVSIAIQSGFIYEDVFIFKPWFILKIHSEKGGFAKKLTYYNIFWHLV